MIIFPNINFPWIVLKKELQNCDNYGMVSVVQLFFYLFFNNLMYKKWMSGKWFNRPIPFIEFTGTTGHCQVVPEISISKNRELVLFNLHCFFTINICFIKICSKLSSVLLLCLLRIFMKQMLWLPKKMARSQFAFQAC